MPTRQEMLDTLRQQLGDENYIQLMDTSGGEDKFVQTMGGEDQLWKMVQTFASTASSSTSSSSNSTSRSSEKWTTADTVALWMTIGTILVVGVIVSVNAYDTTGWSGVIWAVLGTLLYGYNWFQLVFWLFRNTGWVLGGAAVLGITGLLLYGLYKAGVFVVGSTGSFFQWLFGHFF